MIHLNSLSLRQLKKKNILSICKLKNDYWKYGLRSNLNWFKKNIKTNDIHNLLFIDKKLIGYTLLRKRKAIIKNKKKIKKINFLYFDTLIIKKNFRKKKYSKLLMDINSKKIIKKKLHSFLICSKKLTNYYKRFGWKILDKKKFQLMDHKSLKIGMTFNKKFKLKKSKLYYYTN